MQRLSLYKRERGKKIPPLLPLPCSNTEKKIKKNWRKQMLSSPASGNYLFHEGTLTAAYLGERSSKRIATSAPFCLRLHGCFSLPVLLRRTSPKAAHTFSQHAPGGRSPCPACRYSSTQLPTPRAAQPLQEFSICRVRDKTDALLLPFGQPRWY